MLEQTKKISLRFFSVLPAPQYCFYSKLEPNLLTGFGQNQYVPAVAQQQWLRGCLVNPADALLDSTELTLLWVKFEIIKLPFNVDVIQLPLQSSNIQNIL